ncbi:MAG: hypothetical protein H6718_29655 [Polyangiaceae bacterium]|nr:hypothetical protein [Myxococcales bacterium]MCB9589617.1 hypothetical protein [Polyangiaceae bacterium]
MCAGLVLSLTALACTGEVGDAEDFPGAGTAGQFGVAGSSSAGNGATGSGGSEAFGGSGNTAGVGNAGNGGDGGSGNTGNAGSGNTGNGGSGNTGNGGSTASGGTAGSASGGAGNGGSGNAGGGGTGNTSNGGTGGTGNGGTGNTGNGGSGGGSTQPGVVGVNGVTAWDALSSTEKAKVNGFRSFFLHQSVGQDLEDGVEANGFRFEYCTSGSTSLAQGLNGGLFSTSNGNPSAKISEFRSLALNNAGNLRVAIMKFGYADIVEGKAAGAQTAYQSAVADIKAAGVRVLHVTPPFVYNVPAENSTKMNTRTWMIQTFPGDVIFDLEDLESTEPGNGSRCTRGGYWEICNSVRSTSGCPSNGQGVDAPSGQGHICYNPHAMRIGKALLYAIYLAGN